MALANVAALLAKWGSRVLAVDWDLEAPGLERYFTRPNFPALRRQSDGIVDLVTAFAKGEDVAWRDGLLSAQVPKGRDIAILHAGRDDDDYPDKLRAINWSELFERGLGNALELIRDEARIEYDFVLIDSRTGITDIGGICTILLPDIVISFFTANEQSLFGVAETMRRAQLVHETLPLERNRLLIVPVSARDESLTEYERAREWRGRFAERMRPFYNQWIPRRETAERVLDYLKIPHVPFWSFGEGLPVLEEATDNPKNLAFSYTLLARLIRSRCDWSEVESGQAAAEAEAQQQEETERRKREAENVRLRAREAEQERAAQQTAELRAVVLDRYGVLASRTLNNVRRGQWSAYIACGVCAMSWLAALGGLASVMSNSLSLVRSPDFPTIVALTIVGLISAVIGGPLWIRTIGLRSVYARLEREHVAWKVGHDPYDKQAPETALRTFAERTEAIVVARHQYRTGMDSTAPTSSSSPPSTGNLLPAGPIGASDGASAMSRPIDVLLIYHRTPITDDWVHEFRSLLVAWLTELLGRDCVVQNSFEPVEQASITAASSALPDSERTEYLLRVPVVIAVITRRYLQSPASQRDLKILIQDFKGLFVPVSLDKSAKEHSPLREYEISDFSDLAYVGEGFAKSERSLQFQDRIRNLAGDIAAFLDASPSPRATA
jgi:cellulose biosynthesis protein BcsQ